MATIHLSNEGGWRLPRRLLRRGVAEVLREEKVTGGDVSLTFLADEGMRALNREYLQRDRPTDVIAFALHPPGGALLGDVYVGYQQAQRQADELGVDLAEELLRLTIHGVLHVLGHDHPEGEGREESPMFLLQERVLRRVLAAEGG